MEWYFANEGQRSGPVSAEEFARRVAAGTVRDETLVWRAGMAGWLPWREVAPTVQLPSAAELPPPADRDEPAAFEAKPEPPLDAETFWQRIQANGYTTSIGACLERGWSLYKAAFGPCLGATLLGYLIIVVAANVPLIGVAAQFVVVPQLTAGLYWYFLRRARGEPAEISDLFAGYSRGFGQLALLALFQFLIVLPLILVMMAVFAGMGLMAQQAPEAVAAEMSAPAALTLVGLVLLALVVALLMYRFILAHIIVIDRGEAAWGAMKLSWRIVGRRYWTLLGLAIVLALLSLAGVLALLIGVLFVLPLVPASYVYAYEDAVQSARGGTPAA